MTELLQNLRCAQLAISEHQMLDKHDSASESGIKLNACKIFDHYGSRKVRKHCKTLVRVANVVAIHDNLLTQ